MSSSLACMSWSSDFLLNLDIVDIECGLAGKTKLKSVVPTFNRWIVRVINSDIGGILRPVRAGVDGVINVVATEVLLHAITRSGKSIPKIGYISPCFHPKMDAIGGVYFEVKALGAPNDMFPPLVFNRRIVPRGKELILDRPYGKFESIFGRHTGWESKAGLELRVDAGQQFVGRTPSPIFSP